jgi:tetratricopeptide (TPR) repeat protein
LKTVTGKNKIKEKKMKRIITLLVLACLYAGKIFPTTQDECGTLWQYFGKKPAEVYQKIGDYQAKLKADSNDYYADLAVGILYFALAYPTDLHESNAATNVIAYTDKFLKQDKDNPLGLVYNGVAHGLLARDSDNVLVKMVEANNGSSTCDKAVKLSQGSSGEWYIRFMRANFYQGLPGFFGKRDIAREDYRFVETLYNKDTNNNSIAGPMGTVYFYLGEIEKSETNIDKAIEYWKKSVQLNSRFGMDTPEGRKAKKEIDTFSD